MITPPEDTGRKTVSGRTLWRDTNNGELYSEKTRTIRGSDGLWYNVPTVLSTGFILEDENQLSKIYERSGFTDTITGERFVGFKSISEAVKAAKLRSSTRLEE